MRGNSVCRLSDKSRIVRIEIFPYPKRSPLTNFQRGSLRTLTGKINWLKISLKRLWREEKRREEKLCTELEANLLQIGRKLFKSLASRAALKRLLFWKVIPKCQMKRCYSSSRTRLTAEHSVIQTSANLEQGPGSLDFGEHFLRSAPKKSRHWLKCES